MIRPRPVRAAGGTTARRFGHRFLLAAILGMTTLTAAAQDGRAQQLSVPPDRAYWTVADGRDGNRLELANGARFETEGRDFLLVLRYRADALLYSRTGEPRL